MSLNETNYINLAQYWLEVYIIIKIFSTEKNVLKLCISLCNYHMVCCNAWFAKSCCILFHFNWSLLLRTICRSACYFIAIYVAIHFETMSIISFYYIHCNCLLYVIQFILHFKINCFTYQNKHVEKMCYCILLLFFLFESDDLESINCYW